MQAPVLRSSRRRRQRHTLAVGARPERVVVMFICNHCPYVKAVIDKIVRDTTELARARHRQHRDLEQRPRRLSRRFVRQHEGVRGAPRHDDSVCLRRIAGRRARLRRRLHAGLLRLRPRPDARLSRPARRSGRSTDPAAPRELFHAMVEIARTGKAPRDAAPSIGCSIKWRASKGRSNRTRSRSGIAASAT